MFHKATLSEEDKAVITEAAQRVATFNSGDRVTVEPADNNVPYFGEEYEGVLLTVAEVVWSAKDLSRYQEQRQQRYPESFDEKRVVETSEGTLYLEDFDYRFEDDRVPLLGEYGLISWEEYCDEYDRMYLKTDTEDSEKWLETTDDLCETCGCNTREHWYYNDGYNSAGREECAACGHVFEEHHP